MISVLMCSRKILEIETRRHWVNGQASYGNFKEIDKVIISNFKSAQYHFLIFLEISFTIAKFNKISFIYLS